MGRLCQKAIKKTIETILCIKVEKGRFIQFSNGQTKTIYDSHTVEN